MPKRSIADIRSFSPEDAAANERLARDLRSQAKVFRDQSDLLVAAAEAVDRLVRLIRSHGEDEGQLDPWFRDLRGERAADFLISLEPARDHTPAEIAETMIGNGWMAADSSTPLENARGALDRLVRKGLAVRVGRGRYRTTRTSPLLDEMDID